MAEGSGRWTSSIREVAITLKDVKTMDWKIRLAAIRWLQVMVQSPEGQSLIMKSLVKLCRPLQAQVRDLRSVIAREACSTLTLFAEALGNRFSRVAPILTKTLLLVTGSGNKVIGGYCAKSAFDIVRNTESPKSIAALVTLTESKSSKVRDNATTCLSILLEHWNPSTWLDEADTIGAGIKESIEDNSKQTRDTARRAFHFFQIHAPEAAEELKSSLGERALSRLQYGTVTRRGRAAGSTAGKGARGSMNQSTNLAKAGQQLFQKANSSSTPRRKRK